MHPLLHRGARHAARDVQDADRGAPRLRLRRPKINLHEWGREFKPHAHLPVPGALDLCFISSLPLDTVIDKLRAANVKIIEGPVRKTGAQGPIRSVYVRDPDLNLVEISVYES